MNKNRRTQAAVDLRAAAALIDRLGWSRDPYFRRQPIHDTPPCIATAMCLHRFGVYPTAGGKEQRLRDPRYRASYDALLRVVQGNYGLTICQFNQRAYAVENVVRTIRFAADQLAPAPAPPLVPVYADATERRRAYRAELLRLGADTSDLPPLGDGLVVEVPDVIPVEWMGVR